LHMKCHDWDIARDFLTKVKKNSTVWIVQSKRSVLERGISVFFQTLCREGHPCLDCKVCSEDDPSATSSVIKELVENFKASHDDIFNNNLHHSHSNIYKKGTGIDIVPSKFDHAKGRLLVQNSVDGLKINTVILRLEDISRWPSIMQPMFPLYKNVESNVASEKWYADIYHVFKASLYASLNATFLEDLFNSFDEMSFYTSAERDAIAQHSLMQNPGNDTF